MTELPDEFKCVITNWDYIYDLCREVSHVKRSEFEPDVIVALARGGWFAGRCLCDFLGMDDLTSLKMEHYVGTAKKIGSPRIRYPMPEESVEQKRVLIIDDIADTGGSIERAYEYVQERNAKSIRTATLQVIYTSEFEPDFVGERLDTWAWVVFPWNFIEDMTELIAGVMDNSDVEVFAPTDVRRLLDDYHQIDRIGMEIAQPNRLDEILRTMEDRGMVDTVGGNRWRRI